MKLTGNREELLGKPCEHCSGTGKEPRSGQRFCSVCLGMQFVNGKTDEHFNEFDSARIAPRIFWRKDTEIKQLKQEINRLRQEMKKLKPYMDQKAATELAEKIYPKEHTRNRASTGNGGFGD